MRRPPADPGVRLLREDPEVRRHLRRVTVVAGPLALLVAAQGLGLAATVVALAQQGRFAAGAATTFVVAAALRGLLGWWLERAGRRTAAAAIGRLRDDLVGDAAALAVGAPGALRPGEVATDVVSQLPAIESLVGRFLALRVTAGATTLVVLGAVLLVDPLSAFLLAPTVPLLIVFLWLVGAKAGDAAERRLADLQLLGAHLLDVLRGLLDLRAHGRAAFQRSQVGAAAERYRLGTMATLREAFVSGLVLELIAMLGTALVAVIGGVRLAGGHAELAVVLPALVLAPELYAPLRRVGAGYHEAADARAALARLAAVRAAGAELREPGTPGAAPAPAPSTGDLVLRGVGVGGSEGRPDRLHGVDLVVPVGQTTALVGPSGAGKSTLASVVLGLLRPDAGTVQIGGIDLADRDLERWRARCAWVPQDPALLPTSLRENVRLAAPHAGDDAVRSALAQAGLAGLEALLPQGLDTRLGAGGAELSSGELRRLALARAVLGGSELVVLDEPTAQLDARSARRLLATITRWARGRTVVLITHDPAVAARADHIARFEDGRLVDVRRGAARQGCKACPGCHDQPAGPGRGDAHDRDDDARGSKPPAGWTATAVAARAPRTPGLRAALRLLGPSAGPGARRALAGGAAAGTLSSLAAVAVLAISGGLIVQASTRPPVLELTAIIVLVRLFSLVRALGRYGERLLGHDAALRVLERVRVQVFTWTAERRGGTHDPARTLDAAVGDVDRSADLAVRVLVPALGAVAAGAVATLLAAGIWPAVGALLGAVLVGGGLLLVLAALASGRALARAEAARSALVQDVVTATAAAGELRLAGRTQDVRAAIRARGDALESAAAAHGARSAGLGGALSGGAALLGVAVAALLAPAVAGGELSGALAAALVLGSFAAVERLEGLTEAGLAAPGALGAVGRLAPALVHVCVDDTAGRDDVIEGGPGRTCAPRGAESDGRVLRASGLVVRRSGRPVLNGASFALPPGEVLAIQGESGAGKSTLLLAAAGLLAPEAGTVRSGAIDLGSEDDAARSRTVLLVASRPHLFGGSLAANLRLARPAATDDELTTALATVGLGDWARALPDGLDTLLGEDGLMVSGGQRQRIGLARAVLSPAPVVLLDEPASHLPESDALAALARVIAARPGRAALLVSHRAAERDLASRELLLAGGTLEPTAEPVRTRQAQSVG